MRSIWDLSLAGRSLIAAFYKGDGRRQGLQVTSGPGSAGYEAERTANGEVRIWLAAEVVNKLRAKASATSFCGWRLMASRANTQRPDQTARLSNLNFEGA
jgi:hypothetical protein